MRKLWKKVKLAEVLTPVAREEAVDAIKEYRLLGIRLDGQGPFLRETLTGTQTSAAKLFRVAKGDFIYSRLFAWRGAFGVIDQQFDGCYVSGEFPTFLPKDAEIDVQFLRQWFRLRSTLGKVEEDCTGSTPLTRNRFKENFFLELQVPLPPFEEQRRIVARIEELGVKVEEARGLRQRAMEEVKAFYQHIVADLFPEPAGSVVGDFIRFQTGYAFQSEWFSDVGIRLARNVNIGHGMIDWSETARIPEERRMEFLRFELKLGDILVSLDRPIISTGVKVARVKEQDLPCLLLQRVARTRFQNDNVLPDYFYQWLQSPHFVNAIDPGRSNGVPHISHKDIEKIPFTPPSLTEQHRILTMLGELQPKVDALRRAQTETGVELGALMPSILDRAFRGEL